MIEFALRAPDHEVVCVLVHQIVGLSKLTSGRANLYTAGGHRFELKESYDEAHAKLRNATGPKPPGY